METKEVQTIKVTKEGAIFINDLRCNDHDYFFREKDNISDSFSYLELVSDNDFPENQKAIIRQTLSNYNCLINALCQNPDE